MYHEKNKNVDTFGIDIFRYTMYRLIMDKKISTFVDIINLWDTCVELGNEVGATGLTVRAWKRRNNIPSKWWSKIEKAAVKKGYSQVSIEILASIGSESHFTKTNSG